MAENPAAQTLWELFEDQEYVTAPGGYHALDARMAEMTGNSAVYCSGASVNIGTFNLMDGVIGRAEMVEAVKRMADATELPVIADADTGYGGPMDIQKTVRDFEDAGAAALHIEDQQLPKSCGLVEGIESAPQKVARNRVRAAVDAKQADETIIIARTDAMRTANGSWEESVERGRLFLDVGADMIYVGTPSENKREAHARYVEEVRETHPDARFMAPYSSSVKWSEDDDPVTFEDLNDMGYDLIVSLLHGLQASAFMLYEQFKLFAEAGEQAHYEMEAKWEESEMVDDITEVMYELGNFEEYRQIEQEYSDRQISQH